MIEKTPNPNILRLVHRVPQWGKQDPETHYSEIVVLIEIGHESINLWYLHHRHYQKRLSGTGPDELKFVQRRELDEAMKGLISGCVMHEFWTNYGTVDVRTPEAAPDEVKEVIQAFRQSGEEG